ncbi:MAG: 2-succinyl-5-enolpyruvyl-6-hydroxy-3-cyclohexene-1-carboxylic-acid synthase [Bacteroidia bacterium]|nr:2-succinyl-5-enolpyruvyl-6-hydroxy-3-cyclohexene-1-carboxylic-acid synthase [Bacteroidia bacterium]
MQQHVHSIAITCRLLGVKHVVISPGSRSAPLALAFAQLKKFNITVAVDERAGAYIALGIAQQKQIPVVLICTSGTASANYLPAITEAFYQKIPLLVLTADRPEELLNQQDGQMINQQNLYGSHVRGFYQLKSYAHGNENHRETTAVVADAIGKTTFPAKGPVHINIPLKEPLYAQNTSNGKLSTLEKNIFKWLSQHVHKSAAKFIDTDYSQLEHAWINSSKKIILIGQGAMHETWITPLLSLKNNNNVVILTDVVSNKHSISTINNFDKLISAANSNLLNSLQPDFIISVGGPVLSKSFKNWLKNQQPKWHFRIQQETEMVNTYGNITQTINARVDDVFNQLASIQFTKESSKNFSQIWVDASLKLSNAVNKFTNKSVWSELHVTNKILQHIPLGANVQLANSSVVRYVSWLGNLNESWLINSNRGTSGIDGCTSTALGAATVNNRLTVLLTGDLAFLYDKNAFWLTKIPNNLRVVVLNNGGGGIFTLIDGPTNQKEYASLFTTPHKQSVKSVATDNQLDYYFCDNYSKLNKALVKFFDPTAGPAILELAFSMKDNAKVFETFKKIKI